VDSFNGNGQIIYFDPEWVSGKTCLFNVHNTVEYYKGLDGLSRIRKEFIKKLENMGFVITYTPDPSKDILYFTMDGTAICDKPTTNDKFKKMFDEVIFKAGGKKLNYPHSLSLTEYFNRPFYPAVFKNELMNGGKDKFLIESEEQVKTLKRFYEEFKNKEDYKYHFGCTIMQQLITTPTEYTTYMRVLMSASGDVLGASLKYSRAIQQARQYEGVFEKHFLDPNSKYYLDSHKMFNYYSNGGNINLAQSRFNYVEKELLLSHGIDSDNAVVPEEVLEVARNIAVNCNRELGIMCGIDFILDEVTNKWYYLEVQAYPAMDEWLIANRIRPVEVKNINHFIKYNAQDLEARFAALMLYMENKPNRSDKQILARVQNNE